MKLRYYILIFIGLLGAGCAEQEPNFFIDSHFIRFKFDNEANDYYKLSHNFSFGSDASTEHEFTFPVTINGMNLTRDLHFGVSVDEKATTLPADCYNLKSEQVFRSGIGSVDSLRVTLFRKAVLKKKESVLRLQLVNTDDIQLNLPDSSYIEITVSDIFTRPIWWDTTVENAYLGKYSKEKYNAFTEVTQVYDFGILDPSEKRHYVIKFKRSLEVNPRYELDGSVMTVTISG